MSSASRLCCFFLPPIYGVLAFSYIWILGGLIIAITGWSQVYQIRGLLIPVSFQIALCFHAVLFTWLAVLGVYGIAAASLKRPGLVLGYFLLLGLHLLLSFVGGTYYLAWSYLSPSDSAIEACVLGLQRQWAIQLCITPITFPPGAGVVVYVVSWILELYACWMVYSYFQMLKERAMNPDLEGKLQRRAITPESIGEPVLIPNYKPENIIPENMMSSHGYPISIIFDPERQSVMSGVPQHTWAGTPVLSPVMPPRRPPTPPRRLPSPPTTPVTPSRADLTTGIKPLMLNKGPASQPNSPQVPTTDITSSILPPYDPASPAYHAYEFSTPGNSFGSGSPATTPTQAAYSGNNGSAENRF